MSPRQLSDAALLASTCKAIHAPCARTYARIQAILDNKTKPRGSLGRLEELACRLGAIHTTTPSVPLRGTIVVMGADHGVAEEGVSAFPQSVTLEMLRNFAAGGAAINVLARQADVELVVVDMGIAQPLPTAFCQQHGILDRRLGSGTANFVHTPAMTPAQAHAAIATGIRLAHDLAAAGTTVVGLGEMGIANTTAASAIVCALLGLPAHSVAGRGTGVNAAGLERKIRAIQAGLLRHAPQPTDAVDVLHKVGGFEIGGLVGLTLGAAALHLPVVVDGFIASAAALLAERLAPAVTGSLIAAHASVEPGHAAVLEALGQRPLLALDMRLGEGTGVALAMQLCRASLALLHEMATFDAAGVSTEATLGGPPTPLNADTAPVAAF